MMRAVIYLYLIAHFLGDFYFQTDALAQRKNEGYKYIVKHSVIYGVVMLVLPAIVFESKFFLLSVIISSAHFVIDSAFYSVLSKIETGSKKASLFLVDQMIHISIIILSAILVTNGNFDLTYQAYIHAVVTILHWDMKTILSWILVVLVIIKPSSITIRKILNQFETFSIEKEAGYNNAGALIGVLERLLIVVFLSVNQYSAIGFVLTAKSITRYSKIVEDKEFSEYYLLGTLLSMLIVLIVFHSIF